ncbi:MAG TPA: metallophosphoesterase [Chloroflexota bacterium]|nr:metallophosphoesterase [Chloroflexota bacterium]
MLVVADTEDRALYEHFNPQRWAKEKIELIVSCGDLRPSYLDFLVSVFNVPCFYVRGNHDGIYDVSPPPGCINIDDRLQRYKGVRFYGLEGSRWYNGGPAQYTEGQMRWRAFWAGFTIWQARGVDVIVAHNPPRMCPLAERHCRCILPPPGTPPAAVGQTCYVDPKRRNWDMADLPHRGSEAWRRLILKYQPRYFLHGHTHLGYGTRPREFQLGRTRVVDAFGFTIVDL